MKTLCNHSNSVPITTWFVFNDIMFSCCTLMFLFYCATLIFCELQCGNPCSESWCNVKQTTVCTGMFMCLKVSILFAALMLPSQTCMDKHQVVGVLRQMEKFLKGQEMRFTEGLRIMKSKLATLQNSVSKMPQADQSAGEEQTDAPVTQRQQEPSGFCCSISHQNIPGMIMRNEMGILTVHQTLELDENET